MAEPKFFLRFDGEGGIVESKGFPPDCVLKVGIGNYIINPTDEQRAKQYRIEHPTKWDRVKGWFKS